MPELFIGSRRIAEDAPAYFVADIAANHDGDLERAKALIHLAAEAGAVCVLTSGDPGFFGMVRPLAARFSMRGSAR